VFPVGPKCFQAYYCSLVVKVDLVGSENYREQAVGPHTDDDDGMEDPHFFVNLRIIMSSRDGDGADLTSGMASSGNI